MKNDLEKKYQKARRLFPHTKNVIYFNSASYGPFSIPLKKALEENCNLRLEAATDDSHDVFETKEELRKDIAGLTNARVREIGISLNTSFGLNLAAFGLPLKKGDEILVSDVEFPAVVYAFKAACETRGLKLKFVPSRDRCFDIELLKKSITKKTRLLAVSWVQFFNGYKNDLKELSDICKKNNMYFVIDGIQGMGVEPIDMKKYDIDVFSSGCQKWMLSPQGCGFFYLSDRIRDSIKPTMMSWLSVDWKMQFSDLFKYEEPFIDSAQRFELGYYVVMNILGMKESVKLFRELGPKNIQQHNYALIDRLAEYIDSEPYYSITSSMVNKHRSSIFTFTCKDYRELWKNLSDHKIILVPREGSIRLSVHLFNNKSDIDKMIKILKGWAEGKV